VQGDGAGNAERNILRAVGPWADLERLSYHSGDNLRLNIPADLEGAPNVANVTDAVRHLLEQSVALGARFAIGNIDLAGQMPAAQFDNTTCAAILVQLLRRSPGAICSWDYSGAIPMPAWHSPEQRQDCTSPTRRNTRWAAARCAHRGLVA
jgi:hypothetical protein